MCTLTILKRGEKLIVTMNRDESRSRAKEIEPKQYNELIYPLDTQFNGTWIGAHQSNGNFACLLNYYEGTNDTAIISRGHIIPKILNNEQISNSDYKPFRLVKYINNELEILTFNGQNTKLERPAFTDHFFITSSSLDEEKVTAYRKGKFQDWLKSKNYKDSIPSIHFQQEKGNKEYSILVSRPKTHTKSLTQFVFKRNELIESNYLPQN